MLVTLILWLLSRIRLRSRDPGQSENDCPGIFSGGTMFKNWKTTLAGVLGFVVAAGSTLPHLGHFGNTDFTSLGLGVASLLLGALAKDHDVTGGTTKQ